MKTLNQVPLTEFSKVISKFKTSPIKLGEIGLELGARYALMAEKAKELKVIKAHYWVENKVLDGKSRSDTMLEMEWATTESGQLDNEIKLDMKGTEKLMSAIKSMGIIAHHEATNTY